MDIKKNISLIIGLSIPVLMIILVAASIYIPTLFMHPTYNFLYIEDNYSSDYSYSVGSDGRLERGLRENDSYYSKRQPSKIYFHDVQKNESRGISFSDAQKYILSSKDISPDGFEVAHGSNGGFLFFDHYGYDKMYLKKRSFSRQLNLQPRESYYNFQLLGWVIK